MYGPETYISEMLNHGLSVSATESEVQGANVDQ